MWERLVLVVHLHADSLAISILVCYIHTSFVLVFTIFIQYFFFVLVQIILQLLFFRALYHSINFLSVSVNNLLLLHCIAWFKPSILVQVLRPHISMYPSFIIVSQLGQ